LHVAIAADVEFVNRAARGHVYTSESERRTLFKSMRERPCQLKGKKANMIKGEGIKRAL
jgi:hypothetical protein